ncbi:hypothetical protein TSTA_112230 [Talaromyces stipitatus ATCC 10500]|uniref:Uncharacterized protein n=1 Tax=Talaromyces stipitatus (strain ATCC 10500 / CBS 375.48 / QM 6759 / NRRL 1006) TaxID=441959 RepID=B8MAG6_TALSN|nr:uncharacterized protein TSTA_112230 [Talaromyces stipitatus ATCC 10500]EED17390.1 hypothetical protein TSTA_112230 [Talaromyces stipitatus ATCC 10500]
MFENFSFPSPSSTAEGDDRLMLDCDSTTISPLSSRCPSPSSFLPRRSRPLSRPRSPFHRRPQQPPTSMPSNYEQFQRRISVSTLTEKLNAHTLDQNTTPGLSHAPHESPVSPISPTSFSFSVTKDSGSSRGSVRTLLTPPGEYDDEGYDDLLTSGWEPYHNAQSPTSIPLDSDGFLDVPQQRFPREQSLRSQRQQMSRAQCNVDVLKLALLAENFSSRTSESVGLSDDECHPSSLPPDTSPPSLRRPSIKPRCGSGASVAGNLRYRSRTSLNPEMVRRRSTSSAATFASSTRIAKPRARELLSKKSEQTLRRKSLVCATIASAMEKKKFILVISVPASLYKLKIILECIHHACQLRSHHSFQHTETGYPNTWECSPSLSSIVKID